MKKKRRKDPLTIVLVIMIVAIAIAIMVIVPTNAKELAFIGCVIIMIVTCGYEMEKKKGVLR